jgi:hypothetical protein
MAIRVRRPVSPALLCMCLLTASPLAGQTLSPLTVSPASVPGGSGVLGTVTLSGPAPAGGTVVSLGSSDTAVTGAATLTGLARPMAGTHDQRAYDYGTIDRGLHECLNGTELS